jgi:hypothetical protein
MTITEQAIHTRKSWPHKPTTPGPTITLTTNQAQRILRSLASGFASTTELNWLAEQLGPDHLTHPIDTHADILAIQKAIHALATKDRDDYQRGYQAGRYDGALITLDHTWATAYEAGYTDGRAGNKSNPTPPDNGDHEQLALAL